MQYIQLAVNLTELIPNSQCDFLVILDLGDFNVPA